MTVDNLREVLVGPVVVLGSVNIVERSGCPRKQIVDIKLKVASPSGLSMIYSFRAMDTIRQRRPRARISLAAVATLLTLVLVPATSWGGATFAGVRSKGVVRCGVSQGLIGLAKRDTAGRWNGFEADFCRAVAAAALGDPEKVVFVPITPSARFPRLLSGEVDLLMRSTTWTLGREAFLGVQFAGILYHDGQAFMLSRKNKAKKIANLNGATICLVKGTTHIENLSDYFGSKGLRYRAAIFESVADAMKAFLGGSCAAYTSDYIQLSSDRAGTPGGPDAFMILPELISREPVGPVVRRGDEEWLTLVKWVLFTLIEAEDRGITRENVRAKAKTATDPSLRRFLGLTGGFGKALGVRDDWTIRIIESVGNYGEIFERNLGRQSPLKIERGMNRPWTRGGLLYAPPFR